MLFLKSMYKVSYLLEQVIKNNLLLDYSAMLTVSNPVSCDHGKLGHRRAVPPRIHQPPHEPAPAVHGIHPGFAGSIPAAGTQGIVHGNPDDCSARKSFFAGGSLCACASAFRVFAQVPGRKFRPAGAGASVHVQECSVFNGRRSEGKAQKKR